MQADVAPFSIVDVHLGFALESFLLGHLRFAVFQGRVFPFALNQIVARPRRDVRGKFAPVVGSQVPVRIFLFHRMDFYFDAVQRAIIRPVGGAKDHREGLCGLSRLLFLVSIVLVLHARHGESGKQDHRQAHQRISAYSARVSTHISSSSSSTSSSSSSSSSSSTGFSSSGLLVMTSKSEPHSGQETISPSSSSSSSTSRSVSHSGQIGISLLFAGHHNSWQGPPDYI